MQICQEENLKLNKNKQHFRCTRKPFFEVIFRNGLQPDLRKLHMLTEMPSPNNKKELESCLGIMNYLMKYSPLTAEECEPLRNSHHQKWVDMEQYLSKPIWKSQDYHKKECNHAILQWERGAIARKLMHCVLVSEQVFLQVRDGMQFPRNEAPNNAAFWPVVFASKSPSNGESHYSKHRNNSPGHIPWPWIIPLLLFHLQSQHDYRPQIADGNFQERHSEHITQVAKTLIHIYQYRIGILYNMHYNFSIQT